MKLSQLVSAIAFVSLSTAAVAGTMSEMGETVMNPAAVSVEVSTFGYGGNVAWGVNDKVEVMAGWNGGSGSVDDIELDDVDADVEIDFNAPYIGAQIRPMSNWLTVGTGVYMPTNTITATAVPEVNKTYEYNGKDYKITESGGSLVAEIENKNALAPYVTIGFRPNVNNRFGLFGEIGAAYVGGQNFDVRAVDVDGKVEKTFTQDGITQTKVIDVSEEVAELEQDFENELRGEISDYDDWWPMMKVGATVRF